MINNITKIAEALSRKNLDALLVTNIFNVRYLTGFSGSSADILITKEGVYFITDFRYLEQAEAEIQGFSLIKIEKTLVNTIKKLRLNIKRLGVEGENLTYSQYEILSHKLEPIQVISTKGLISTFRQIKNEDEIKRIKTACEIAHSAYLDVTEHIKEGISEEEIAARIEYAIRCRGALAAFETIVISGERSSLPHGRATNREIKTTDLIILDWGANYQGYNCDITRTGHLDTLSDKKRLMYDVVLEVQSAVFGMLKPGMKICDLDKKARLIMKHYGYDKFFGHNLGHGVGLEVHEFPHISSTNKSVLKEGMVFTIEPGIYIPSYGGVRIEDMVVITNEGYELLT